MEAKKLEILMTAVDLGSFSKASEVVGYTQSGLTHLVNSLEREIGFPLIIRSHNGISLTEQGKELGAGYPAVPSGKCQSGKSDPDYYQATDGNYPDCRLCQYGHVLDAGNIVPFSQDLPKSGCRPADGG